MQKFFVGSVVFLFVFSFTTQSASAQNYKQMVLGESTEASELTFPQIASGPGVITPDSPLYFLDKAYQGFRLALASPEDKAKIRTAIAGERLAELRLMMAKNDEKGINTALSEMTLEMDKSAEDLIVASGKGSNVEETATQVNQSLKEQRFAIKSLIAQAKGDLRLRLLAANAALKEAKVEVEGNLSEEHLLREIEDDLTENIEEEADMATESAKGLENAIIHLDELASQAASKEQVKREEALRHAIEVKNDALVKQQAKQAELRKRKELILKELQKKRLEAATVAREKAEEARIEIKQAKEEKVLLELEDVQEEVVKE